MLASSPIFVSRFCSVGATIRAAARVDFAFAFHWNFAPRPDEGTRGAQTINNAFLTLGSSPWRVYSLKGMDFRAHDNDKGKK